MIWRTCAVIHEVEVLDTWRIEARIVGRCLPEIRKSGGSAEIVGADLSPNGPATSAERKHGPPVKESSGRSFAPKKKPHLIYIMSIRSSLS